jgi:ABC-2 type transport system ATP-binding protein
VSEVVSIESLSRRYGDRLALDGVSFSIAGGEVFGLLGPNGGGKTTLFRILTTLLPPSGGRAAICGHDVVRQRAEVRGQIGVVFQSPSLDLHLTARENLRHGGHLYGLRGAGLEERIVASLERLGVADRADDLVRMLSGGLRRRVEIAKCMLHRPALLILDEPSTGLDPGARMDLWRHLEQLVRDEGTTVLLTTHFMEEAERCHRLALLDRGRLVACGTPSQLKSGIGGDCITIDADDAHVLREAVDARFGCRSAVVGRAVRIESAGGPALVARLMEDFGPRIRSVTIGKPTLEDVFVHLTGHRFEAEDA